MPKKINPDEYERRYVFIERPLCPLCRSSKLLTTRSTKEADGANSRRTRCRLCGWVFTVVVEDMKFDNS